MASAKKQGIHFALEAAVAEIERESRVFWSRSPTKTSLPALPTRAPPARPSLLAPYTPPDALIFALFSAIQRKAWARAKKLCNELLLCDQLRPAYYELYLRLDQIMNLSYRRLHPRSTANESPSSSESSSNVTSARSNRQIQKQR